MPILNSSSLTNEKPRKCLKNDTHGMIWMFNNWKAIVWLKKKPGRLQCTIRIWSSKQWYHMVKRGGGGGVVRGGDSDWCHIWSIYNLLKWFWTVPTSSNHKSPDCIISFHNSPITIPYPTNPPTPFIHPMMKYHPCFSKVLKKKIPAPTVMKNRPKTLILFKSFYIKM